MRMPVVLVRVLDDAHAALGSSDLAAPVAARFDRLQALTRELVAACAHDKQLAYWVADDYLRAVELGQGVGLGGGGRGLLLFWAHRGIERAGGARCLEGVEGVGHVRRLKNRS